MSITMSRASLPVFCTALRNLDHCLGKAAAYAQQRKFDVNVLVSMRLAPDMLPFASQIRIACDAAKLCVARLGGLDAPKFDDTESTFAELRERIARTLAWLDSVPADVLDGTEDKEITFPVGRDKTRTMKGEDYLRHWALPNVFFHVTMAYALLRHNGVDLGKIDYLLGADQPA
ncbi:conserved hypothetical protein [Leptothrix cholodnii SP-6]|uniref:DUF1993 domain-containing protein n=1 Tax=Leptothrix cholodnii (strain ATCC 51168 / LMG 8142 / SP-6) TaxID=395495 RepID=B1Y1G8_LEPCP|nr:DUF1993 domain-containing protein [Leptothrix cholodnii]ACB34267.1 conserved hypothetical protein [Leptothrix cholodnii SP-6]